MALIEIAQVCKLLSDTHLNAINIATITGFLDAERRQPTPQRKRHDIETTLQQASNELDSP